MSASTALNPKSWKISELALNFSYYISGEIYSDQNIKIFWDSVNKQFYYSVLAPFGFWDSGQIMKSGENNNAPIAREHDAYLGDSLTSKHFGNSSVDTAFNMLGWGSHVECWVAKENGNSPRYHIEAQRCGNRIKGLLTINRE